MTWVNTDVDQITLRGAVLRIPWEFLRGHTEETPVWPDMFKDPDSAITQLLIELEKHTDLPEGCAPMRYRRCMDYNACELVVMHGKLPAASDRGGFGQLVTMELQKNHESWKWVKVKT